MTEVIHFSSSSSDAIPVVVEGFSTVTDCDTRSVTDKRTQQELSLVAIVVTLLRKSLVGCKSEEQRRELMEIGWPTNVRHVAHVTFDRFNGFLGLPLEFHPEVSTTPPSARYSSYSSSSLLYIYISHVIKLLLVCLVTRCRCDFLIIQS